MASSSKTANLGLNNWAASDRPKRSDFVNDNSIIDSRLGGHINDANIHLSSADREKLDMATRFYQYQGNGAASRNITMPFEATFAIIYKKSDAPVEYNSAGYVRVNSAFAGQAQRATGGAVLDGTTLTVTQSTSASQGVFYNLNSEYAQYLVFLIH